MVDGLTAEYGDWVDALFYDVDHPANRGVSARYGVRGLPTTIILDGDGQVVSRLVGYADTDQLRGAIDRAIAS